MAQLSAIIVTTVLLLFFGLFIRFFFGGWTPNKILQGIDKALSKSQFRQVSLLLFFTFFTFALLVSFNALFNPIDNRGFDFRFWSSLKHFFSPGSFYETDGIRNEWIILLNISGMILMTGLLISVLSNLLERRVDNLKNGRFHYHFKSHILIIGYAKMTTSLIKQIAVKYPAHEIVLQTIQDVPAIRHELFSQLDRRTEERVIIVSGNRTSREDLIKLHPDTCLEIFLLGENDEYDHDSASIQCLEQIGNILQASSPDNGRKDSSKPCHVLFEHQSTYTIFQHQSITMNDYINFMPFNFYEMWARKVFVGGIQSNGKPYPLLDRDYLNAQSPKYIHFVVVAATRMGVAMALQVARIAHFPNFRTHKTRITIIDRNAQNEMNILRSQYAAFFEGIDVFLDGEKVDRSGELSACTDIEFHFIQADVTSPEIRKQLVEWTEDPSQILTLAICLNYPPASLAVGLYLPDELYENNIPILIRQETSGSILRLFGDGNNAQKYKEVYAFGMTAESFDMEMNEDTIPQYIQHIYYNRLDFDQKEVSANLAEAWLHTPVVHKWSNRYNADMIPLKLRQAGMKEVNSYATFRSLSEIDEELFHERVPDLIQMEHNRWVIEKLLAGFRYLNDERKQKLFASITDDELKHKITHLKENKDKYFRLEQKRFMEKDPLKAYELKTMAERMRKEMIKPAKDAIESVFYHDCIVPYEDLSDDDQYSDRAISIGLLWIIKNKILINTKRRKDANE